jgi:1,4-dihydroxy-6-naphthoate synthase
MNSNKLRIGLSPCPNDTFICDALLHGKIDTEGLSFEPFFADVETLNGMALRKELDFLKMSFHTFLFAAKDYLLLNSGCALGNNCGPLLIAKNDLPLEDVSLLNIGIPGRFTTANLLFSLAFPEAKHRQEMVFSEIEDAVLSGAVDAGIIIHENRFTYRQKGLKALMDLGAFWEGMTGYPIPLGGFMVGRELPRELQDKLDRVMHRSVSYAFDHPESSRSFVKFHAQSTDDEVIKAHIDLYVTDHTRRLNAEARDAIIRLFEEAHLSGLQIYQHADFFL